MRISLLFASLMLSQTGRAELVNIQSLNQKIRANGGGWVAGQNHLTDKSADEMRRSMGLMPEGSPDIQFVSPDSLQVQGALPEKVDWRDKNGKNWISPMKDQANCGSCVAFASIGVLESQYKISALIPDFNIKLSPQYLFSCGGGWCELGWTPGSAAKFLKKNGAPDESCMPYQSGATGLDVSCKASCSDVKSRIIRIEDYETPTWGLRNINAVKKALQKGPLVTSMKVYKDFVAYAGGVYKHTSGEFLGGHAISIVGYDDSKRAFIIRNSWGEEWGEKGFAYVSYSDESGIGDSTWFYNIPKLVGAVSVQTPDSYSYYSEQAPIDAMSSFPNTDSIEVTVYNVQNQAVANLNCPGDRCAQKLNIESLTDGRYEVLAQALNSRGEKLGASIKHFFYVVNQPPSLSVAFKGYNGTDMNIDLKGRAEFEINAKTSSVPMSSIEFHRRGPDGKEVVKAAQVVPEKLTMGWRTNVVPNGTYEIWYVGRVKTNKMDVFVESNHVNVNIKN